MLQSLPARLNTLTVHVFSNRMLMSGDGLVKEDGELKAMRTTGLELLDPALSRDNFGDLKLLTFELWGYRDTLPPFRESTLQAIRRKLPALCSRVSLNVDLKLLLLDRSSPPSSKV